MSTIIESLRTDVSIVSTQSQMICNFSLFTLILIFEEEKETQSGQIENKTFTNIQAVTKITGVFLTVQQIFKFFSLHFEVLIYSEIRKPRRCKVTNTLI